MCEKNNKFDKSFIYLARNVYKTNDLRFKIKNEINVLYQALGIIMWSIIVTLVFAYMKQSTNFIYFQF